MPTRLPAQSAATVDQRTSDQTRTARSTSVPKASMETTTTASFTSSTSTRQGAVMSAKPKAVTLCAALARNATQMTTATTSTVTRLIMGHDGVEQKKDVI